MSRGKTAFKIDKTFVEQFRSGIATESDFDEFVHYWHDTYSGDKPLHEFLGMTWDEYRQYNDGEKSLHELFPSNDNDKISRIAGKITDEMMK